ncbi:hypothetical protein HMPREF3139_07990 [Neisseria sp. HMSC15G01]|nr:hypothetical protein HMPREF3139_07990 [Neisseria sp. HMSC15G01]
MTPYLKMCYFIIFSLSASLLLTIRINFRGFTRLADMLPLKYDYNTLKIKEKVQMDNLVQSLNINRLKNFQSFLFYWL